MSEQKMLYCTSGTVDAMGYQSEDGFTVIAGSVISDHTTDAFEFACKHYLRKRNQLIADGTIRDRVFVRDYTFSSATAAGSILTGRSVSGRVAWRETKRTKRKGG